MVAGSGVGGDPLVRDAARLADGDLLLLVREGSPTAWEELVERYQTLAYSVALAAELQPEEALDVARHAFMAVLEAECTLGSGESVVSWLTTVVRREAWRVRRSRDRAWPVAGPVHGREPAGAFSSIDWEVQISLHDALHRLGNPCRGLIEALYFDPAEPSYSEIARRLDRAVGSIGPLRGRCLGRLRRLMGDTEWQ